MNAILRNQLRQLDYEDPEEALQKLFAILHVFTLATPAPDKLRDWRLHKLRNYRESEQAAWLAYALKGAGLKPGLQYAHYPETDRDFDAAVRWGEPNALEFATLQLKEVVRSELNLAANLQTKIDKFQRYNGAGELIGGVFVNRDLVLDPDAVSVPHLKLRELWTVGFATPGEGRVKKLELYGDFLRARRHYTVPVPDFGWRERADLPWG